MRPLQFGSPTPGREKEFLFEALRQIEIASNETTDQIYDGFTISEFTPALELRTLNVASATLSDVVRILATIIVDNQKRGSFRTDV